MSGFIAKAACRGNRPSALRNLQYHQRPLLVSRMMRNREVARFIIAPTGYGKSTLALDYAETVFSCEHVFWVNGTSPCFLRDLDDGVLAASFRETDPDARLVVFDDVPFLDEVRTERFSALIDEVLSSPCEVIVALTPSNDMFASLQRDRLCLWPDDLLLSDLELNMEPQRAIGFEAPMVVDFGTRRRSSNVSAVSRVAALAWPQRADAGACFLEGLAQEDMPADMRVCVASIHAVGRGDFAQLQARIPDCTPELLDDLAQAMPHLGIDCDSGWFETADFPIGAFAHAYKPRMKDLAAAAGLASADELAQAWAYLLADEGSYTRACRIVHHFCLRSTRAYWLSANCRALLRTGCFYDAFCTAEATRHSDMGVRVMLNALKAICLSVLDTDEQVENALKPFAFAANIPIAQRMPALVAMAYFVQGTSAQRARELIAATIPLDDSFDPVLNTDFWTILGHGLCYASQGESALYQYWTRCLERGYDQDALALLASFLFDNTIKHALEQPGSYTLGYPPVVVEGYIRARLRGCEDIRRNYFVASAGLALERAYNNSILSPSRPFPSSALIAMHAVEADILRQRRVYKRRMQQEQEEGFHSALLPVQGRFSSAEESYASKLNPGIPILSVRMFGRFDIAMDGEQIELGYLSRKKVQLLLFILVLSKGREVHRDTLASLLWPYSAADTARRNLWSISSKLKKSLSLPDGSCPYILKTQRGLALNEQYVRSDVARLDEICRELQFGTPDVLTWTELYREIGSRYCDELLPAEKESEYIARVRNEYRVQLVDALVLAAVRITQENEPQCGIWLSRCALDVDPLREDAYLALMRAQAAAGQRTAAIMTFLDYRSILRDELGIDPSREAVALYERLIAIPDSVALRA